MSDGKSGRNQGDTRPINVIEPGLVHEMEESLSRAEHHEQSRLLLHEARLVFPHTREDYSYYERTEALLERALRLWPENHEASKFLGQVRLGYAHAAMAMGDLRTARDKALNANDADEVRNLLERIEAAEHASHVLEPQGAKGVILRAALLIILGLAVMALIGIVVNISSENKRLNQRVQSLVGQQRALRGTSAARRNARQKVRGRTGRQAQRGQMGDAPDRNAGRASDAPEGSNGFVQADMGGAAADEASTDAMPLRADNSETTDAAGGATGGSLSSDMTDESSASEHAAEQTEAADTQTTR